jgi:preprotein translocase subunit SecA
VSARVRLGLIASIERRIGASLGLGREFKSGEAWDAIRKQLVEAAEKSHTSRAERSLSDLQRELAANLPPQPDRHHLTRALISMAWGTATAFDQKTHRKVQLRTQRLNYFFAAAEMVEDWDARELKEEIVAHLRGALDALYRIWGEAEFRRLATTRVADLPETVQSGLRETLSSSPSPASALGELSGDAQTQAQTVMGRHALTQVLRQLMLHVIGGLWVEYLTAMEALRTSIGLEAYAQRDPLAAYKSRAFEMFQELLVNMRAGVVSRAFTVHPRLQVEARGATPAGHSAERPVRSEGTNGGAAQARNLGRNDPCWCGSGKKYKECHWEADHASAPAEAGAVSGSEGGGKRRRRRR